MDFPCTLYFLQQYVSYFIFWPRSGFLPYSVIKNTQVIMTKELIAFFRHRAFIKSKLNNRQWASSTSIVWNVLVWGRFPEAWVGTQTLTSHFHLYFDWNKTQIFNSKYIKQNRVDIFQTKFQLFFFRSSSSRLNGMTSCVIEAWNKHVHVITRLCTYFWSHNDNSLAAVIDLKNLFPKPFPFKNNIFSDLMRANFLVSNGHFWQSSTQFWLYTQFYHC